MRCNSASYRVETPFLEGFGEKRQKSHGNTCPMGQFQHGPPELVLNLLGDHLGYQGLFIHLRCWLLVFCSYRSGSPWDRSGDEVRKCQLRLEEEVSKGMNVGIAAIVDSCIKSSFLNVIIAVAIAKIDLPGIPGCSSQISLPCSANVRFLFANPLLIVSQHRCRVRLSSPNWVC